MCRSAVPRLCSFPPPQSNIHLVCCGLLRVTSLSPGLMSFQSTDSATSRYNHAGAWASTSPSTRTLAGDASASTVSSSSSSATSTSTTASWA
eukprot:1992218-Amphidinium_carterae.1